MTAPLLLDLRHYETISAIVEFGTMTEASRHLAISQSALSHRLAEAERRLGTQLFERGPRRRLVPNGNGFALHQAASRALADLERAEAALIKAEGATPSTLRFAVGSYDCYHWVPAFAESLSAAGVEVDIDLIVVGDAPGPVLASHEVDLVIAPGRPDGDHELRPLFDDDLVLVTGRRHPLAETDVIEAEDLADEIYLTYNARPTPGFEYDRFIRPARRYPRIVRVVRQTSAIVELVAAGGGVSILSRWALEPNVAAGRVSIARCGEAGLPLRWHALYRRDDDVAAAIAERLAGFLG